MATIIQLVVLFQLTIETFSVEVFKCQETNKEYVERMIENNLPCVGDLYNEDYKRRMEAHGKKAKYEWMFRTFIDGIPRIYETMDSVNYRNLSNRVILPIVPQYSLSLYECLMKFHYPRLYESYDEYCQRMQDNGGKAFSRPIFIGFKNPCPIFGETYATYEKRLKKLGLLAFPEEDFDSFTELFPLPGESDNEYYVRSNNNIYKAEDIYRWVDMIDKDYKGLYRLIPQYYDTYEMYQKRVTDLDLNPISENVFDKIYSERFFVKNLMKRIYNQFSGVIKKLFQKKC